MNKKKIITCCIFLALILFTIVFTVVKTAEAIQYEHHNNDMIDNWLGLGVAIVILVGGFVVLCELDLFCTVYYFLFGKKRIAKTVFCILSNLCLIWIIVWMLVPGVYRPPVRSGVILVAYVAFRTLFFVVPSLKRDRE